jgi:TonB-dependent SusC/RagA subfamily outer membrane receptor
MKKQIILLGVLLLCINVFAQSKKLTIKVSDADNKSISGAIILFDDVRQKRWTNSNGVFKTKLDINPKEISAFHPKIGIKKIKYNGAEKISIKIIKGDNIYAKKKSNLNKFHNIYDYLRGRVPGVNITASNVITIRGYNTFSGNTTPLFILDGLEIEQGTFGTISPYNIKSIKVLKGPDTSIYGLRGANGVIVVKTMK